MNRPITTFDEVPPSIAAIHIAGDHGVTLFKTCTAEVFRPVPKDENRSFQVFETRKDSAVHVSLSSSLLVKQPGTRKSLSLDRELSKSSFDDKSQPINLSAVNSLVKERSFRRRGNRSWPRAKTAPRSVGRSINPPARRCQRLMSTNRRTMWSYFAAQRKRDSCEPYAVLEPQSCDVLEA